MAAALAPERLEIHIDRPLNTAGTGTTANTASRELTSNGVRTVTFIPVGESWQTFGIARHLASTSAPDLHDRDNWIDGAHTHCHRVHPLSGHPSVFG